MRFNFFSLGLWAKHISIRMLLQQEFLLDIYSIKIKNAKVVHMAKARARSAARKVKDRWRSKSWYQILAPTLFNQVPVSETLSEKPENIIGRTSEVSLKAVTNDFRKSHVKLHFRIDHVEENKAFTTFKGHELTSDYIRRMIRRRKSRVDGVYDVQTKDGAILRVKPFAITDKRVRTSQKGLVRSSMQKTILAMAKTMTMNEFIRAALDGKIGSEIYKDCKKFYPVKRVEVAKSHVFRLPTVEMEDSIPAPESKEKKQDEPAKDSEKKSDEPKEEPVESEKKAPEAVDEETTEEEVSEEKATEKEEVSEPEPEESDEPKEEPVESEKKSSEEPADKKASEPQDSEESEKDSKKQSKDEKKE